MTGLFKLLFPHASTSAELAQVEKELQAQIDALRSRLEVAAAQAGVIHETNEILLGSLRGRVTALEARANAQANLIDALESEVSRPLSPETETRLTAIREAIKDAETLAIRDGEAVRTKVVKLDPTKGPKGGSK